MKPAVVMRGVAVLIAASLVGSAAQAVDLNGAWANNLSVCNKIFTKKNNKISITRDSDQYGSGFIVSGNEIRGKVATCAIKSRKDDGPLIHLVASCSTDIALSTVQFSFKVDNENRLTRVFAGLPEMAMPYERCKL